MPSQGRRRSPFADVKKWRAADKHTGIDKFDGHVYTYEHIPDVLEPRAEVYRIETYIPFAAPTPVHRDVCYVPGDKLDEFFNGWEEVAQTVVDVRPLSLTSALAEITAFRRRHATRGKTALRLRSGRHESVKRPGRGG